MSNDKNPFRSFWMGGFECADHLNKHGNRVDFLNITHHLTRINDDYKQLGPFNIATVREGIRWSYVEKSPYQYDFSTVKKMLASGKANHIQQVWDICHFGFPADLTPFHPHFANRFTSLCRAFVKFYRKECPDETLIITPINEVSFLSWLGGEDSGTTPYCTGRGWQVKYALMEAYIMGIYAMKEIDPGIRILTTEPLVNMVPPLLASQQDIEKAAYSHQTQFQSLDILAGTMCPELGGSPELLDLLGFNFYYNNQWVNNDDELRFLPWQNKGNDPRWKPMSELIAYAYERYNGRPVVITETSHPEEDRDLWIKFIGDECKKILNMNIPLLGVCLYPIIDRPDWDDLNDWHHSGLWDEKIITDEKSERVLNVPYSEALIAVQTLLNTSKEISLLAYT